MLRSHRMTWLQTCRIAGSNQCVTDEKSDRADGIMNSRMTNEINLSNSRQKWQTFDSSVQSYYLCYFYILARK